MSIATSLRSAWATLSRVIGHIRRMPLFQNVSRGNFITGFLVAVVLGGGYAWHASASATSSTVAAISTVERRDITTSIKAIGKVTFASEQELKFNQKGTVTKVSVKEGDKVKQGQVLAELDKSSVLADIRQAQLTLNASALQLKQLQNDRDKTVADARNNLKTSQEKLPSDLTAAERAVTEKQAALSQAQSDLEKQKVTEYQNLGLTAQNTLTSSEKLLDSFYGLLTRNQASRPPDSVSNENATFDIDHLLYNDQSLKNKVVSDFLDALSLSRAMHSKYGSGLSSEQNGTVLVSAMSDAVKLAQMMAILGDDSYSLLQGATTDTSTFTVATLQSYRSTVNANRDTAANLMDAASTAQANLKATATGNGIPSVTLKAKEDAVTSASNALLLAQDNLRVMQTQTPGDLESAAQALNSTVTSTDTNIQLKQNDVSQKAVAVQKTSQNLKDYQLTAPFDGIVTHIDYKVGDNLLDTGDTETAVLQNPDFIVVTIPLDQVDVVHVKLGMSATIVFDAVPGRQFTAVIDRIDSTPLEQSGVVSYEVELKLPTPKDLTILSGMTTTVTISTDSRTGVLAVPNLALRTTGNMTTVRLSDGRNTPVTTGLTDGRYTEILTGLNEGDGVVSVNIVTASATSQSANSAQQLFRLGGGGGGAAGFGGGAPGGGGGTRRAPGG